MKKGIANGPATINCNDKRVCRTNFFDQIEMIKSSNHPIGPNNIITKDRAVVNCILVLASLICFLLIAVVPELGSMFQILGALLYVG